MKISVCVALYNEEKNLKHLLDALLCQTKRPEEIIFVDDGSADNTREIIKSYAKKNESIRYFYQKNKGPASARNLAWKKGRGEIIVLTDGDCVPNNDWIEKITKPFEDHSVGAVGGAYRTINKESLLASFIGYEFERKYKMIEKKGNLVDSHGTYNLAIRKNILEKIGGFSEDYPCASCEDLDLTYKVSKKYKIVFSGDAIVGHFHPNNLFNFIFKNQVRRGFDRVKLYRDHGDKINNDSYTEKIIKYQVGIAGLSLATLFLFFPVFHFSYMIPTAFILLNFILCFYKFNYYSNRNLKVAFFGIFFQFFRNYSWFIGFLTGTIEVTFKKVR
jgi:glycosyltransferase involved in cell wall biosynthesis